MAASLYFFLRLYLLTLYVPNSSKPSPQRLNSSVFPSSSNTYSLYTSATRDKLQTKKCRRPVVRWELVPAHPSMAACHSPPPALGWEGRGEFLCTKASGILRVYTKDPLRHLKYLQLYGLEHLLSLCRGSLQNRDASTPCSLCLNFP